MNDKDKKELHRTINNINMAPIFKASEIMNSMDMGQFTRNIQIMNSMDMSPILRASEMNVNPILDAAEIMSSMNMNPVLNATEMIGSMNMNPILWAADTINLNPILRAAEVMSSMDITPLINSLKGINTLYINSEFLSSETLSSLKDIDSDKDINIAIPVREPIEGCEPVKDDFNVIPVKESDKVLKGTNKLERAIEKLENLLESGCNEESQYQSLLKENPELFGHMYSEINSHQKFDDKNIPDYTGLRVIDNFNDIFEIKAPFIDLFKKNGEPSMLFHEAWRQIERYSNFAEDQRTYLSEEKGLRFENPKIFLYLGYNLDENQKKEIRKRERNSSLNVTVYTYNDLLKSAKNLLSFLKKLIIDEENS